jgi:hypothetical protein
MVVGRLASGPNRVAEPGSYTEPCDAQAYLMTLNGVPLTMLALPPGSESPRMQSCLGTMGQRTEGL